MLSISLFSKALAVLMSAAIPLSGSSAALSGKTMNSIKKSASAIADSKGYITLNDAVIDYVDREGDEILAVYYYDRSDFKRGEINFSNVAKSDRNLVRDTFKKLDYGQRISIVYQPDEDDNRSLSRLVSLKVKGLVYVGDVDDNGIIDIFDRSTLQSYISGKISAAKINEENSDINNDGIVDDADLQQLTDYLIGRQPYFNGPSPIGSERLGKEITVVSEAGKEADEKFVGAQMKFATDLMQNVTKAQDANSNILVSPLSVMTALAMTANGADGTVLKDMEKTLGGLSIDDLNEYLTYYIHRITSSKSVKVAISDSIWFRNIPELHVKDSFLETNAKYYNAESYKTDFDDNTVKDINSWVNGNTRGLIPKLFRDDYKFTESIMMCLINTLYFDAEWSSKYRDSYKGTFTDASGAKYSVDYLSSEENRYYELDGAKAFKKNYEGGDFSFVGILPDEGTTANDYISTIDPEKLIEQLSNPKKGNFELHVTMPKFEFDYSTSLGDILKDMGMESAFDENCREFSKICDPVDDTNSLHIDDVIHKTKIVLNENGTKAAAVTAVMMSEATACLTEIINLNFNRPYVFMIVDNQTNLPLFIGVMNHPNQSVSEG